MAAAAHTLRARTHTSRLSRVGYGVRVCAALCADITQVYAATLRVQISYFMHADMLTKVLDRVPFVKLRRLVMNLLVRSVTAMVPRANRRRNS